MVGIARKSAAGRGRVKSLASAWLITTAITIPISAWAQDASLAGANPGFEDQNGVSTASRQFVFPNEENSFTIGDLTFSNSIGSNLKGVMPNGYYSRLDVQSGSTGITGYINLEYVTGGRFTGQSVKSFIQPNYKVKRWNSQDGDGSYILFQGSSVETNSYVYYAADGAKYHYKTYMPSNSDSAFVLSKVEYPDGRIITIYNRTRTSGTYQFVVGPQTITSNRGYMLQFEYKSDTPADLGYAQIAAVTGYNLAEDVCLEGALHCNVVVGRPKSTFTYGDNSLTQVNPAGKTSVFFTTADGNNTTLHIRLPDGNAGGFDNVAATSSASNVLSVTKGGGTWTYTWGPYLNDLTENKVFNPNGSVSKYGVYWNLNNRWVERLAYAEVRESDAADSKFSRVSYEYNSFRNLKKVNLPTGGFVEFERDGYENVVRRRQVSATPNVESDIINSATFPASCSNLLLCHLPTSVTNTSSSTDDYEYDSLSGQLTKVKRASVRIESSSVFARPTTVLTYAKKDAYYRKNGGAITAGGPISVLTATSTCLTAEACVGSNAELKTDISYGPQAAGVGNNLFPVAITRSSGDGSLAAGSTMTYDSLGRMVSVDGPLPGTADTVRSLYDIMGRSVGQIGAAFDGATGSRNAAVRQTYDDNGRLVLTETGVTSGQSNDAWLAFVASSSVSATYDSLGHKVAERLQSGQTVYGLTEFSYDATSRLICKAVRMVPAQGSSDADICAPRTTGANNPDQITKFGYDYADRLNLVQRGFGTVSQANERAIFYTDAGLTASVVDANGNRTSYSYDGHGRLEKTRYPSGEKGSGTSSGEDCAGDCERRTYANNRVSTIRLRSGGSINFEYDALDQVTSLSGDGVPARQNYYNLMGMKTASVFANQTLSVVNKYDAFGRTTEQGTALGAIAYEYDVASRLTKIKWPDEFFVNYSYGPDGKIKGIFEAGVTSGLQALARYSYDDLGRRSTVNYGNGASRSYAYDAVNRLTGLKIDAAGSTNDLVIGRVGNIGSAITYDAASRITGIAKDNNAYVWSGGYNLSRLYDSNRLNQYTASGISELSYDMRGNLIKSRDTLRNRDTLYSYDGLNELISVSGGLDAGLTYDPEGRLFEVAVGSTKRRFLYAGSQVVGEYDGSNFISKRYVPGVSADEPIVWYEGAGNSDRRWLQADERGSVISVLDNSGSVIGINRYDEYGIPQSSNIGSFQYTGQIWVKEVGLYYYKARFYSPTLGRFMQTDPIGYADGMNWYNYAGADPINNRDPSGLASCPGFTCYDLPPINTPVPASPGSGGGGGYPGGGSYYPPFGGSQPLHLSVPRPSAWSGQPAPGIGVLQASASPQKQCRSAPISSTEAAAARAGNRKAFWTSRLANGDPIAATALSIVNDTGLGRMTNGRLLGAIYNRSPNQTDAQAWAEIQTIGVEIMQAHVVAVGASGGNLSAGATAQYHFDVFAKHRLDPSTFGGAAFTGSQGEASMTSPIWRNGCW